MLTPSPIAPTLRVAIYRASSLGDVVLATACLDLLDLLAVPTEITWVGRGAALEMVTQSWPAVKGLTINRSDSVTHLSHVVDALAGNHLFIDLQCNLRSQWLRRNLRVVHGVPYFAADKAQLARSRLILEARWRGRRRPLPARVSLPGRLQHEMMVDALKRGLRHHLPVEMRDGVEIAFPRPRLPIPDAYDRPWRKELRFGAWLAVAPGAAHPTKQAPLTLVQGVLERVKEGAASGALSPIGLAFVGDNDDRQAALHLLDHLQWNGPVLNLAGRLSLWETAVALKETSCLLSNDSSLGHIAEAVDTPAAILFGPTVEAFGFAPRMARSRAFSSPIGCRPCSKHGKIACRFGDKLCFSGLSHADIAGHLLGLLASPNARHRRRTGASVPAALASPAP